MSVEATIQNLLREAKQFVKQEDETIEDDETDNTDSSVEPKKKTKSEEDKLHETEDNESDKDEDESDESDESDKDEDESDESDEDESDESDEDEDESDESDEDESDESDEDEDDDVKEAISALFNGETLTEDFRHKAKTIFEAAVTKRVKNEVVRIKESYNRKLVKAEQRQTRELIDHIDGYLNLMVEQWMEKNEIALVSGMKANILESFVGGLKNLFESHYIEVPDEKFNIVESLEKQVETLNRKLDEVVATNVKLNSSLNETIRKEAIRKACEGLTTLEAEKLQTLVEELTFEDTDSFSKKLKIIRENYFVKKSVKSGNTFITEESIQDEKVIPAEMSAYVKTISMLNR